MSLQTKTFKNIGDVSTHLFAGAIFAHGGIWADFGDGLRVSFGVDLRGGPEVDVRDVFFLVGRTS